MRLALVIAPSDARSGEAGARREALAWLRGRLARFGFHVVIIGGAQDPQADVDRATARVSQGDTVLVHVSGRLEGRDAIAFGENCPPVGLGALTAGLAARCAAHVSFVLELAHEEAETDVLGAAEILAAVVQALGAKGRGYPVLASVRPLATPVDRLAFTRLAMPAASEHAGPPPTEVLLARMYDAARASGESPAVAQSFTLSRGGASIPPPDVFGSGETLTSPVDNGALGQALGEVQFAAVEDSGASSAFAVDDTGPASARMRSSTEASIHSLIAEATELGDWSQALELRRYRLHVLSSPRQKSKELVAIARILQAELDDPHGAIEALEMARALDPKPIGVLQALRRGYEKLGRWGSALEVATALAALTESPRDRANLYVACARIAIDRMGDEDRAVAWFDAALNADPAHHDAIEGLARLRASPHVVEPVLPAPAPEPDAEECELLADRLFAEGADDGALAQLEIVAAREPTRVSVYEKTFAAHRRAGRTDAALLAALALEELDAAEVDEQMLIDQYRSVAPTRVRSSLDDEAWADLRAPGADDVLTALFAAVESAAIAARIEELREQRKLMALEPSDRLSEASTASIVRSFQWAARVLSVDCPHLYLRDDVPGGIAALLAREASVGLGPTVVSGLSAKDLAFLAGRHLTYYRPGHRVLLYYAGRDELATLLLASAQIAMPAAAPSDDVAVRALRTRIARHLTTEQRAALDKAVGALDARGGHAALGAWMCSIELTAGRVGLVLAGDLATASAQIRSESRDLGNVPVQMGRGDLIAFCASRAHAAMRQRFAMTAPESAHPPPVPPASASSLQIAP